MPYIIVQMREITGIIVDGFHVATGLLKPVLPLIEKRMELAGLVPGTLNVRLSEGYIVTAHAVVTPVEYGFNETLKLQRCLIEGRKAIIMRPDTHEKNPKYGHGTNHFELLGPINFREVLGLEKGDEEIGRAHV